MKKKRKLQNSKKNHKLSGKSTKPGERATSFSRGESVGEKTNRIAKAVALLEKYYPEAECALNHRSTLELLVATILSAQCTDERVNMVTPILFEEYPDAFSLSRAPLKNLEEIIRSTGFYKNKAKNIQRCCQTLVEKYDGEIPKSLDKLVELAGVGRKTANVVLGVAFGIPSGVVVDTHVRRLCQRMGLTKEDDPVKIEREIMELLPQEKWIAFSHQLIWHGRKVCKARSPQCGSCFLNELCMKKL